MKRRITRITRYYDEGGRLFVRLEYTVDMAEPVELPAWGTTTIAMYPGIREMERDYPCQSETEADTLTMQFQLEMDNQ